MTVTLGIDPGAKGALAWVTQDGHLIEILDMPRTKINDKDRVSAQALALYVYKRKLDLIVIEGVGPMPKQGVGSTFVFGYAAGLCEGVAASVGVPLIIVPARTWKARSHTPKDKGAARQMAQRLWPGAAAQFARVCDDGRAEAALLARWVAMSNGELNQT